MTTLPDIIVDGVNVSKLEELLTKEERVATTRNSRAINVIYNGVTISEFRRIFICTTAKEAQMSHRLCMRVLTL